MDKSHRNLFKDYWKARMRDPRILTAFVNAIHAPILVDSIFDEDLSLRSRLLVAFTCLVLIIFFLQFLLSLWKPIFNRFNRVVFMGTAVIPVFGLYDIYGKHGHVSDEKWIYGCLYLGMMAMIFLFFHFYCFNHEQRGHTLFGLFYVNLVFFGIVSASYGVEKYSMLLSIGGAIRIIVLQVAALGLIKSQNIHTGFLNHIFSSMQNQTFLKLVVDGLQEGVLLLNEKRELQYANPAFRLLAKEPIAYANMLDEQRELTEKAAEEQDEGGSRHASKFDFKSSLQSLLTNLAIKLSIKNADQDLFRVMVRRCMVFRTQSACDLFRGFRMFTRVKSLSGSPEMEDRSLCFRDIILGRDQYNESIFHFDPTKMSAEKDSPRNLRTSDATDSDIFIQISFSVLTFEGTQRLFIRISDVTDKVLYDKSKGEKELLSLVNATVSHELRNPLNSIMAQNTAKESHYHEIKSLAKAVEFDPSKASSSCSQILRVVENLEQGLQIQDSSANLMSFLVQDFLDYAQLKSGHFRVNPAPFCLRQMVEKVMSIQQEKAVEKKIDLRARFLNIGESGSSTTEARFSPIVRADEQRLMQVLLNLQSNALKFTQAGSVHIGVEVIEEKGDFSQLFLELSVADTGIGIPEEDQEKLFKLFGFIQSSENMNKNGIGLGLMISQRIVQKMGGEIRCSSVAAPAEIHGTTFTFKIPVGSGDEVEIEENSCDTPFQINESTFHYEWQPKTSIDLEPSEISDRENTISENVTLDHCFEKDNHQSAKVESRSRVQCMRISRLSYFSELQDILKRQPSILIVDDQVFNITALKTILKFKFGIQEEATVYALDGQQALAKVAEATANGLPPFKLILMDCNMPIMDGYEATSEIRTHYWRELGLAVEEQPIITAVTGHAEPEHIVKCFRYGMNQVLSKPVQVASLRYTLQQTGLIESQ